MTPIDYLIFACVAMILVIVVSLVVAYFTEYDPDQLPNKEYRQDWEARESRWDGLK
jgi:hypothetical protein